MLESIILRNFQAHKKTKLALGPVTTILGSTDVGKTSIVRALRWLASNRPQGTAYIRHGATEASVTLRLDGHSITRRRGTGTNAYVVDGQTLKAFGADVPEQVSSLLNLGPANWQAQHDPPFWFADGSGEVSRALNAIINLGAIDGVLGHLAGAVRREGAALAEAEESVTRAKETRLALKGAKAADAALRELEGVDKALEAEAQKAGVLAGLVADGLLVRSKAKDASNGLGMALAAERAGNLWAEGVNRARELRQLAALGQKYVRKVTQTIPKGFEGLERAEGDIRGRRAAARALRGLLEQARRHASIAKARGGEEDELNKRFNQQIGPVCPLCNQPRSPSPAPTSI